MNPKLKTFFEASNLNDKDRYEINQIFELLPTKKKQNVLNNFDSLVFKINLINKEVDLERRILIPDIFNDVNNLYKKYN